MTVSICTFDMGCTCMDTEKIVRALEECRLQGRRILLQVEEGAAALGSSDRSDVEPLVPPAASGFGRAAWCQ